MSLEWWTNLGGVLLAKTWEKEGEGWETGREHEP